MDFWDPTIAAIMAIASVLSPKQQQALLPVFRQLADYYEEKGNVVASFYLHSLAQDEFAEEEPPKKPKLYLVKK